MTILGVEEGIEETNKIGNYNFNNDSQLQQKEINGAFLNI